jgi:hypothetical protein
MNEQIKSLIERAEYQAKKQSGYEDWEVYVEPSREQILEKFAELIVKECCQFNYDFLESYSEASDVNSKIREHFRVVE